LYCKNCGHRLNYGEYFCPVCGCATSKKANRGFDKPTKVVTILSVCNILVLLFLDLFRTTLLKSGESIASFVVGIFKSTATVNNKTDELNNMNDISILVVMLFIFIIASILTVLFTFLGKYPAGTVCAFINLFTLAVGFVLYAFAIKKLFDRLSLYPLKIDIDNVLIITYPGIGFIISAVVLIIMIFYIAFQKNKK